MEQATKRGYSREEVRRLLAVSEEVLAGWEEQGFIAKLEEYAFRDLVALQTLRQLRRNRFRSEKIQLVLGSLRAKLRGVEDPLRELKVFLDGRRVGVQVDGQKMDAVTGQILMDFDQEEIKRLLQFPSKGIAESKAQEEAKKLSAAERWFEKGVELENSEASPAQIAEAYQKSIEACPTFAASHLNLGTVYYHQRRFADAERHYKQAVAAREDYALAHFNLGNLYDEMGEWSRALEQYLKALQLNPDYSDAHYNLALLYQGRGDSLKAVKHWRTYLKLDPMGYWADIAKRELGKLRAETIVG
jgi:tetratricopeptide (TPR) repeat protein